MMDVESMIKDVDENDNKYCLIENTGSELLNSDNNNVTIQFTNMSFHWGYSKDNGPSCWGDHWRIAKTPKYGQSPINIQTNKTLLKSDWPQPKFSYSSVKCKTMNNNGHSCQIDVVDADPENKEGWTFKDGPLHHSYKLVQFHFHWGTNDNCGSEHTVDGEEFPLELHLVHFNKDIYKDVNEAIDKPGGMLVLGVLFKVGEINEGLQKLIEHFDNIRYSGESVELPDGFDPASLLPHDPNKYWHYYGSLTTPPLHESVNWIVFQETREVSPEQLVEFRKICNHPKDAETDIESGGLLANNYRPPQDKDFLTEDKNGQKKKVNRHVFSTYKDI